MEVRAKKMLVLGCGYIGLPLALRWQAAGARVTGWVRSEASAAILRENHLDVIIGDIGAAEAWPGVPRDFDVVVQAVSSGGQGAEGYDRVYRQGAERACEWESSARFIFISSTSVYGQTQGEIVTEESAARPTTETSQILRQAEEIVLAHQGLVARVAGIYGPGRGAWGRKFRRGEATIEGDGSRWINQVHRDDVVTALIHLTEKGAGGEIYNVVDDEPCTTRTYYEWLAKTTDRPVPPSVPVDLARKRGWTNKRVSNAKIKELGWRPHYPSFREGGEASPGMD
jgi:nucleoside-diphosphate-sugar epimerase